MRKLLVLAMLAATVAYGADTARPPQLLDRPPVAYPKSQLASQARGFASVKIQVLADGSVGEARIDRSSGNTALDEAALAGVRAWIYRPAQDASGKPVVGYSDAVVDFDPKNTYESYRLGRIYMAYRRFLKSNDLVFEKCAALGVDTRAARAAVAPDTATLERAAKLELRLQDELRAAGHPDPKATTTIAIQGSESLVKRTYDEQFAAWSRPEAVKHCQETLASAANLGFFYPESEELLEF